MALELGKEVDENEVKNCILKHFAQVFDTCFI
jgi:hypothetical protein